ASPPISRCQYSRLSRPAVDMLAPIDIFESNCASISPMLKLTAFAEPEKLANPIARGKAASDQACIFFVIVLLRLGDMNMCISRHIQNTPESVKSDGKSTFHLRSIHIASTASCLKNEFCKHI